MNKTKKLLLAVLAVAAVSGCASTPMAEGPAASAPEAVAEPAAVSRPASYGTLGGYRYRRFVSVTITGA